MNSIFRFLHFIYPLNWTDKRNTDPILSLVPSPYSIKVEAKNKKTNKKTPIMSVLGPKVISLMIECEHEQREVAAKPRNHQ